MPKFCFYNGTFAQQNIISMKKIFYLALGIVALISCSETSHAPQEYVVQSEIFETSLGTNKVYGLSLKIKSPENKNEIKGLKVSFFQNEKVWIDTIYAELNGADTLSSDVIFTQSNTHEKGDVTYKFESFDIES